MHTSVRTIFAGCFLLGLAVSVSATCLELETCFSDLGSAIPSGMDYSSAIDFFCRTKDQVLNCYDKFEGCETYNTYLSLFPVKAEAGDRMTFLCSHLSEYKKAVECVVDATLSLSQAELEKSSTCAQQLLQSVSIETLSESCTLIERLINCSPLMKKTLTCTADLMELMNDNGIYVPCMDVYRSLSSGSRLDAYTFILLVGWLIACIIKHF